MSNNRDDIDRKNTALKINRAVFNRLSASYDFPLFKYFMKKFHAPVINKINVHRKPAPRILDVSCGTGELLHSFALAGGSRLQGRLYGVDLSGKMLEKARNKLPKHVSLHKADVHKLPFPNNHFDYVVTTEAFHHYYDQKKALQEMARVAKIGGKIIIVDIDFFLKPVHFLFQKLEPGGVKINSRKEMRRLFESAGLKIEKQVRSFIFSVMTRGAKR